MGFVDNNLLRVLSPAHRKMLIQGSGGSSAKASGSGTESSNTLRSDSRARLTELISEGPCVGLVNGGASIYFDQTPVVNANSSVNFRGVQWSVRTGTPDQPELVGNSQVETPFSVGVQVKAAIAPTIRTIQEPDATSIRCVTSIPALAYTDKNGHITTNSVSWRYDVRPAGGDWVIGAAEALVNQKCTSIYQKVSVFDLPAGGCPWDVRMVRITPDSTTLENQNDTYWESYTVVVAGRFTYPNSALVHLDVDAMLFGASSLPTRYFDWEGLIIQVPSNYDPVARTYTGIWDGTFKNAWTDNPAWVFYDLVTNDRYGLGEFVDVSKIDKWSLYQIAQYCDQGVPDGFGGTVPRYNLNITINTQEEAYKVLQSITTAWRGMAYWSVGQVFATADMPGDPIALIAPANVIDGHFNYSGTALKARHTVAMVTWNDPDDFYRPNIELVINEEMIQKYGWRATNIQAHGCTNRSLAHRYGKWVLDTEQNETETVEFQASFENANLKPGDIIAIADPAKAGLRLGGRLAAIDGTSITLDSAFAAEAGQTYTLMAVDSTGAVQSRQIMSFSGSAVTLQSAFVPSPLVGGMWVITGTDVEPRRYRVLAVKEDAPNLFTVTSLFHDPTKYARVEQGINFDPIPYSRPKSTIEPPTNFAAKESLYTVNGVPMARILLSWTPGSDFLSSTFHISADTPTGHDDYGDVTGTSYNLDSVVGGDYTFYLYATGFNGQRSTPVVATVSVVGWAGVSGPSVTNLEITKGGGGTIFTGPDCTIDWTNVFPPAVYQASTDSSGTTSDLSSLFYKDNVVNVYDVATNTLLRSEHVVGNSYTYTYDHNRSDNQAIFNRGAVRTFRFEVQVEDTLDHISTAAVLTVSNPAPAKAVPTVTASVSAIFVKIIQNEPDFAGNLIWVSPTQGFNTDATTLAYDGPNSFQSVPEATQGLFYVRAATYDTFGESDLNISDEFTVEVGVFGVDTTQPGIPTNLALTTKITTGQDGTLTDTITATWDPNLEALFNFFDVQIKQGVESDTTHSWISSTTSTPTYQWRVDIAQTYSVRVRAYSKSGFPSAFCVVQTITSAAKTTPPGTVPNLVADSSYSLVFLSWGINPADTDIDHYEVTASDDAAQTVNVATVWSSTNSLTVSNIPIGTKRYFTVKARNTSGLASVNPSNEVYAGPAAVTAGDLAVDAVTSTLQAQGLQTIQNVSTLPDPAKWQGSSIVIDAQDGRLYELKSGAWSPLVATAGSVDASAIQGTLSAAQIASLAAAQITGQLTAAQIASINAASITGTITAQQIASITAAQVAGQLSDSQIAALAAAKLTGQIATTQIADGGITTPKLATGAVVAGSIAAGAITTDKLSIGLGNNLIGNSDALAGITNFSLIYDSIGPQSGGTYFGPNVTGAAWSPPGMGSIQLSFPNPSNGYNSAIAPLWNNQTTMFPCVGGARYEASVYVSIHRVNVFLALIFYDASGNAIGQVNSQTLGDSETQGPLQNWNRLSLFAFSPSNAATMRMELTLSSINQGSVYTFSTGWFLAKAQVNQTQLSDWSPSGLTIINGAQIVTNSIQAAAIVSGSISSQQIAAGAISADRLAANSITAQQIAVGAITATQIAAGTIQAANIAVGGVQAQNIAAQAITADKIAANTITTNQIAANTITGGNIQAGTISADKLVANSITAGQIAAGSIGADQIAAGAITADKIGVGLGGNLIGNSDIQAGAVGFQVSYDGIYNTNGSGYFGANNVSAQWSPPSMGSLQLSYGGSPNNAVTNIQPVWNSTSGSTLFFPCLGGSRYEASVYVSVHRSNAVMGVIFYDGNGNPVGQINSQTQGDAEVSGSLNNWKRLTLFATAPASAMTMQVFLQMSVTGQVNPYLFSTGWYLGKAQANQTQFTAWKVAGISVINGGQIQTQSITAQQIAVASLSADRLQAGTITANYIAAGTITGDKLAFNTIDAHSINIGYSTTLADWRNGADVTKIEGGSIAANTITANKLTIGSRGISCLGLDFQYDRNSGLFSWSAGTVIWLDDNQVTQYSNVGSGSVSVSSGHAYYAYWNRTNPGAMNCIADNASPIYADSNNVMMAIYNGSVGVSTLNGAGTIIDGSRIITGTIQAQQIAAGTISGDKIAANTIQGYNIQAGSVTADKIAVGYLAAISSNLGSITAGYMQSPDGYFVIDLTNRLLQISDNSA